MHDPLSEQELREYSSLVLAYVGDAVFELMVRSHLVKAGNRKVKNIHRDAVAVVKSESQARIIRRIFDSLSEEEQEIVKRGRNAKSSTPRNSDVQEYRMSTGFEALLGFLYLKGDEERLLTLVRMALEIEEE